MASLFDMTETKLVEPSGASRAESAELDDAQRRAVEHSEGPLLVIAGPGAGKTRVLTRRIAHLIEQRGAPPESIVAVTYTVRAAAELRERLAHLVGDKAARINAHTFHGLGMQILRTFPDEAGLPEARAGALGLGPARTPRIMDSAQRRGMLRELVRRPSLLARRAAGGLEPLIDLVDRFLDFFDDNALSPSDVREFIVRANAALSSSRTLGGRTLDALGAQAERVRLDDLAEMARAAELFGALARERGCVGFGDLISRPASLLRRSPRAAALVRDRWRHWLVDEFQDVNAAQIDLLAMLAPPELSPNLTVVGDDDQAIYAFRGADDRAFARFAARWTGAREILLGINHRSTANIVKVSAGVIARGGGRFRPDKALAPSKPERSGPPVELIMLARESQDAEAITASLLLDRREHPERSWSDSAVIARSHTDLSRIRLACELEGIPVQVRRLASPLDDPGVRRLLSIARCVADPTQAYEFIHLLLQPPLSMPVDQARELHARFRAAHRETLEQGEAHDEHAAIGEGGLPSFAAYLGEHHAGQPQVARLLGWCAELTLLNGRMPASATLVRAAHLIDVVHADLLDARARAARVSGVARFLGFVGERQDRLAPPGDLRSLLAYLEDLDDNELSEADSAERLDAGPADDASGESQPDAVSLLTAHSSKGLEFDTVYLPRVQPSHGYPKLSGADEELEAPDGLIDRLGDTRTFKERRLDEERRIFYVACTRAERRLVLLAKKNKTQSRSTHFFEEIQRENEIRGRIATRTISEVFERALRLDVGTSTSPWRRPAGPQVGAGDGDDQRGAQQELERARQEARADAAAALDRLEAAAAGASSGELAGALASAAEELAEAARRLAAVARARNPLGVGSEPGPVDAELAGVRARLASLGDDGSDPSLAWRELVKRYIPSPPLVLSYSAIDTYVFCPRCYLARFLLKMPQPQEQSAGVGILVHRVLQQWSLRRRDADAEGRAPPTLSQLLDMGRAAVEAEAGNRDRSSDEVGFEHRHVEALLRGAFELDRGEPNILEIERSVRIPFEKHVISVRLDRVDEITGAGGRAIRRVVDYKSGGASKAKLEPKPDDLQLCLYAMAARHLGEDPGLDGVAEYWVLQEPARGVLEFKGMRFDKVHERLRETIAGILAGRFERSRGSGFRERPHQCEVLGPLGDPGA